MCEVAPGSPPRRRMAQDGGRDVHARAAARAGPAPCRAPAAQRGAAGPGQGVPRGRTRRRGVGAAGGCLAVGMGRAVHQGAGPQGLARHDHPRRVRRPRRLAARPVRRHRGAARGGGAGGRALGGRPADRPDAAALRHRGAAAPVPAGHRRGRGLLRHRDERARFGLRSRERPHAGRQGRRRLGAHRHQGVDVRRAPRTRVLRPRPLRAPRRRPPPRGPVAVHRRPVERRV